MGKLHPVLLGESCCCSGHQSNLLPLISLFVGFSGSCEFFPAYPFPPSCKSTRVSKWNDLEGHIIIIIVSICEYSDLPLKNKVNKSLWMITLLIILSLWKVEYHHLSLLSGQIILVSFSFHLCLPSSFYRCPSLPHLLHLHYHCYPSVCFSGIRPIDLAEKQPTV